MRTTAEIILQLVQRVQDDERSIGVLSTGETLAVALVLDRADLMRGYTMLEAVNRLGDEWFRAAIAVQRTLDAT
jgi:hypothetical protein